MSDVYAVVVESKEARSGAVGKPIITRAGEKFIATVEPGGWVEATSSHYRPGSIPKDAKTFTSFAAALRFARSWKGHPWWVIPNGNFEIIKVQPVYRQVLDGFVRGEAA